MAKQYGFYIDQSRCSGCKTCQIACKDKNDLEVGRLFRKVKENRGGAFAPVGKGYSNSVYAYWTSLACNHCDEPKCVKNCPTGAMHKREEDGVVAVNESRCIGCRYCTWNCPYEAPQYNPNKGKMSKCDQCFNLVAQGQLPACVDACPLQVIEFGPIEELRQKYGTLATTKGLPSADITKPNIVIKPHRNAE